MKYIFMENMKFGLFFWKYLIWYKVHRVCFDFHLVTLCRYSAGDSKASNTNLWIFHFQVERCWRLIQTYTKEGKRHIHPGYICIFYLVYFIACALIVCNIIFSIIHFFVCFYCFTLVCCYTSLFIVHLEYIAYFYSLLFLYLSLPFCHILVLNLLQLFYQRLLSPLYFYLLSIYISFCCKQRNVTIPYSGYAIFFLLIYFHFILGWTPGYCIDRFNLKNNYMKILFLNILYQKSISLYRENDPANTIRLRIN